MRYDDNGWAEGPVNALPRREATTLFCSENVRLDPALLAAHARSLLDLELTLTPPKRFESGASPNADLARVTLAGESAWVRVFPVERGPLLRAEALRVAEGLGGQGMDLLVKRATRVLQVSDPSGDLVELRIAALLSASFLAVIFPREESALFGIKGARERLERPR